MQQTLANLTNASIKLLLPLSLQQTYANIVKEAIKLVDADEGLILLERKGVLYDVYGSSKIASAIKPRKRGFAYRAHSMGKPFIIHTKDFKRVDPVAAKAGIRSIIFIPLSYRNSSLGALVVRSRKEEDIFFENHIHILKVFGSMASLAIRKAQLYDEVNKALEMRDLFISMAAHEFRTPLTTINGYVQLLSKKMNNNPESDWIRQLSWECYRLNLMINELLEINRIRAGKLTYNWEECHLRTIIRKAIINFKFGHKDRLVKYSENKHIQLDNVIGDFDKLLQVFTNILDNAAKFSDSSTPIRLSFTYRYPWFTTSVENVGEEIDKKDLLKVFDQFYKGFEHKQGLGLGLFLSKNIIERHKGKIGINSSQRVTTVTVKLPRAKV